jgi:hypothetical protein
MRPEGHSIWDGRSGFLEPVQMRLGPAMPSRLLVFCPDGERRWSGIVPMG